MSQSKVTHCGTVVRIEGDSVFVKMEVKSACSECHAKGLCSAADMAEKIVETTSADSVKPGDAVIVEMDEGLGFKAVMFAFFIPFVILAAVLFGTYYFTGSETAAALVSLLALVPYYLSLILFKRYFRKKFVFTCRKISNISQ
ncbi:MAG TPA: SoxR reducing system RseC family protein [bacterium]|nr:SoxR reducing system RseC family protein [bacterium]